MTTLLFGFWRLSRRMWTKGLKTPICPFKACNFDKHLWILLFMQTVRAYTSVQVWPKSVIQTTKKFPFCPCNNIFTATSLTYLLVNISGQTFRCLTWVDVISLNPFGLSLSSAESLAYTESMTTSSTWIQQRSAVSHFNCFNTSIIVCLLVLHAPVPLSFH